MPQLTDHALEATCNGTQATTEPWVRLTRHETAVNRAGDAILHGWREPFELWESAGERRETPCRWTCEECGATGTIVPSELVSWSSSASRHQLTHVTRAFDSMPKLIITEVTG